jgi:hypothetical protein
MQYAEQEIRKSEFSRSFNVRRMEDQNQEGPYKSFRLKFTDSEYYWMFKIQD